MPTRLPLLDRLLSLRLMSRRRVGMLAEAAVQLAIARVQLKLVPFPRLTKPWGAFVSPTDARASAGLLPASDDQMLTARMVSDAVARAARNVPFGAVCLPQAMAARQMLKRRRIGSVMHFGAAKGVDKPMETHAWLDAAGVRVTGYPVANTFTEIGCYLCN